MATNLYALMPMAKAQFFGANGSPLANGRVYTYYPGTTTPKATYADSQGVSYNPTPVLLDSQGRASIWLSGAYNIEVWSGDKTVSGSVLILTQDNVTAGTNQPANVDASQFFVGFNKITVSDVQPTNPGNNDLWIDTSI